MIIHSPLLAELDIKRTFPFLWRNKRWKGKTVWPFIFVSEEYPSRTLIEHEKIHLKQQLKGLLVFFYIKYFYYQWKYGYDKNPYEVEAYAHQKDWLMKPTNKKSGG